MPLAHAGSGIDPVVLAAVAVAAGAYVRGARRLRSRRPVPPAAAARRAAAFAGALLALVVALSSPLDALAGELFAAHMAQHVLLVLAVAPLLALAAPTAVLAVGAPRRVARLVRPARRAAARLRALVGPAALLVAALALHLGTLWAWHLPGPYAAALDSPLLHAVEHATLLAGGLALWLGVVAAVRPRRAGHAPALASLAAAGLGGAALGAVITFAPRPLYAADPAAHGLDPLVDQQLAGVIMWVPGGLIYAGAAAAVAVGWLRAAERGARRRRAHAGALLALAAALAIGAGCGGDEAPPSPPELQSGSPQAGREAIERFGCGSCHMIPGIREADATVGPPLTDWSRRGFIAGRLPNRPEALIRWIADPKSVDPQTAMPDVGASWREARDIAAYLFTLGR